MAFPNFFGKQYESASNFLDDLEMAFLVSGRDEEEVKLRAFPLVLKDSAKNWFQNLEPGRKANWETLKETFLSKYGGLDNPEHLWHRISSLHQATSRTYLTYESQFLRLCAEWEASLAEGERAPNFLKKEKFLAGLFPDLQEKCAEKLKAMLQEKLLNSDIFHNKSFLEAVIVPIYTALSQEAKKGKIGKAHSKWRNYDDFNEFFWSQSCVHQLQGWPMENRPMKNGLLPSSFFASSVSALSLLSVSLYVDHAI
ncbi:hypothetical protein L7F22_050386 [Adiantum nelumboides]|nr:hypothetical protein [Adiantum nelumboides]